MPGERVVAPSVMARRFAAQLLSGEPAGSAEAVVRRLLAVQGQDPRGARLAIRARSAGLTAADIDNALTRDRSLLITWLNRGTLHLVRSADYWWLHQLTTASLAGPAARQLAAVSVSADDADRALGVIERALGDDGPLTRHQLGERIAATGVRTQGQALVYLLFLASVRGLIVRGPMMGGEHAFVLVKDWLGDRPAAADRDSALADLARRYLAGHGPADERDLAKWSGVGLREVRRGLQAIAGELSDRPDGLAELRQRGVDGQPAADQPAPPMPAPPMPAPPMPAPRLLGAFDPVLHGWVSRTEILGSDPRLITDNGIFRAFAMVRGKAAATWSLAKGRVVLSPITAISARDESELLADADDVRRYLGLE